jgi:protein-S-isoprenylcysteine O-methyltransferase Ste14
MMDSREPSLWGVGPSILLSAGGYAAVAGMATLMWPGSFLVRAIPYPVFLCAGAILSVLGVCMLVFAGRAIVRAYGRDELATTGIFGMVRHPIYSAWIVFIIPGLVLFSRSWLLLFTPLVAYLVFKMRIRREDEYLEKQFGQAYLDYRRRVNEIIPIRRRRA